MGCTGRLAEQHGAVGIAAEAVDLAPHPGGGGHDILRARWPAAFGRQAVVGQHGDEPFAGEERADVAPLRLVTTDEATTVEHEQHGARRSALVTGPVDVEPVACVRAVRQVGVAVHGAIAIAGIGGCVRVQRLDGVHVAGRAECPQGVESVEVVVHRCAVSVWLPATHQGTATGCVARFSAMNSEGRKRDRKVNSL
jgi:hypothetical protein